MKKLVLAVLFLALTWESRPVTITTKQQTIITAVTGGVVGLSVAAYIYFKKDRPEINSLFSKKLQNEQTEKHESEKLKNFFLAVSIGAIGGGLCAAAAYFRCSTYTPTNRLKQIFQTIKNVETGNILSKTDGMFSASKKITARGIISIADLNYSSRFKVKELYNNIIDEQKKLMSIKDELNSDKHIETKNKQDAIDKIDEAIFKLKKINKVIQVDQLYKVDFSEQYKLSRPTAVGQLEIDVNFFDIFGTKFTI